MSLSTNTSGVEVWTLPPLILHPFNERIPPASLLENSRAALMLSGLIPNDGTEEEVLQRRVLSGRYAELRMLYFLGKDLMRWMEQCVEWSDRLPELANTGVAGQSFALLLISGTPDSVRQKLTAWGVADHGSIFSRAVGLNALFADPPAASLLNEEFLRNYPRYADHLFRCYLDLEPHRTLDHARFRFELYASGEYSRMLENEWKE